MDLDEFYGGNGALNGALDGGPRWGLNLDGGFREMATIG